MSCVSASNTDTMPSNNLTQINDHIPTDQITIPGSYEDLNHDIQNLQPGNTYDIDKDYNFDGEGKQKIINQNVINIENDNITINGNGHVIDASGEFYAIFKVTGNNVKIMNLTVINSKPITLNMPVDILTDILDYHKTYHEVLSPVIWYGDNGVISDCTFTNNEAINGGAICWKGNNGTVNRCIFINNTARGIGGAIYMSGANNTINNSAFVNSSSLLSHEAIYLDRSRKNINLTACAFPEGSKLIIDGSVTNIDVNYLAYSMDSYMSDQRFNLVHTMYRAIMNLGMNYMESGISYYAQYDNETCDFTLTMIRYFNENEVTYRKDYIFKNITNLNEIFNLMYDGNFVNDLIFMVNKSIRNTADYNAARITNAMEILNSMEDILKRDFEGYLPLNKMKPILNVNFEEAISIKCTAPWVPKCSHFDTVIINGHGSTIRGTGDDSDEYNWALLSPGYTFIASDLTVWGYNTAVNNMGGNCIFNNVVFNYNRMDYYIKRDWGGAIINTGILICNKCSFTNNYAKNGGAIFNQGILDLENCTFSHNKAYGTGDDVCVGDGGKVKVNGENVTSSKGPIYITAGLSMSDVTISTILCIGSTIFLSILAGAASGGMLMAATIGFSIGSIISIVTAELVCNNVFDLNFDGTTYAALLIGGSIVAGITAGIIGYTFFSGATCCDMWCFNNMEGDEGILYINDATSTYSSSVATPEGSILEEIEYILGDDISVLSASTG